MNEDEIIDLIFILECYKRYMEEQGNKFVYCETGWTKDGLFYEDVYEEDYNDFDKEFLAELGIKAD